MATSRARKNQAKKPAEKDMLLAAMEFISLAQKNIGTVSQTHCVIREGWALASDNVLTMATKVVDGLQACPQTDRFIKALRRCEKSVSFTQLDSDRLQVKSGPIRVNVPCVTIEQINATGPNPMLAPLGAPFLDACRAISHLATDGGMQVHLASLLGKGETLSATTGRVMVEYWHGFATPPHWAIPKPAITALMKVTKTLIGLGFDGRTATFHYEDGSWLKTGLYEDARWPNTDSLFNTAAKTRTPVPPTLFTACEVLSEFAQKGAHVRFRDDLIELVGLEIEHAEHEVKGLKGGVKLSLQDFMQLSKIAKTMDYERGGKSALITGDRLRGLVSMTYDAVTDVPDEDIPF